MSADGNKQGQKYIPFNLNNDRITQCTISQFDPQSIHLQLHCKYGVLEFGQFTIYNELIKDGGNGSVCGAGGDEMTMTSNQRTLKLLNNYIVLEYQLLIAVQAGQSICVLN